jgi:hypothetical protein
MLPIQRYRNKSALALVPMPVIEKLLMAGIVSGWPGSVAGPCQLFLNNYCFTIINFYICTII